MDQGHILPGDRWRKWDQMIRWEIFKKNVEVHILSGDHWRGWDGMIRWEILNSRPSSRTLWRQMKKMGSDDQMRDLKTFDHIHIHTGDRWRRWDGMIRWEIFRKIDEVHVLSGDDWRGWDGMIRWEILNSRQVHILPEDKWRGWDKMIR